MHISQLADLGTAGVFNVYLHPLHRVDTHIKGTGALNVSLIKG